MALYQSLSFGADKTTVVFDIGTAYTKVGYAAENGPRSIVPSQIKRKNSGTIVQLHNIKEEKELYGALVEFLHNLYFRHLMVNPKERKVVVVESILSPTMLRETVAKVLFSHFEVPSVLFAPSHLVSLFTLGIQSGLVIDVGFSETLVLPIYEGIPIIKAWQALPLAGKAIQDYLEAQLLETGTVRTDEQIEKPLASIFDKIPADTVEDIKVRCCFVTRRERAVLIHAVSAGRAGAEELPAPPPQVEYPLDGGKVLLIDGKLRENACEVLFEQDNEEKSVATLVLDSLLQVPIDMRKQLAENLVVIGGTSQMPGFLHRLKCELKSLVAEARYRDLAAVNTFKFHSPPAKPNYVAWLGGALFGALEILPSRSVSREDFLKDTFQLPDWCSLNATDTDKDDRGAAAMVIKAAAAKV